MLGGAITEERDRNVITLVPFVSEGIASSVGWISTNNGIGPQDASFIEAQMHRATTPPAESGRESHDFRHRAHDHVTHVIAHIGLAWIVSLHRCVIEHLGKGIDGASDGSR